MKKAWDKLTPKLRKWLLIFFALCGFLVLLDLVIHKHGDHGWNFFSFYALYGFFACVILVIIAKWMRTFLMRDEDYYD